MTTERRATTNKILPKAGILFSDQHESENSFSGKGLLETMA